LLRQAQQPCFDKLSNLASTSSATLLRQAQQPCFDKLNINFDKLNIIAMNPKSMFAELNKIFYICTCLKEMKKSV